MIRFLTCVIDIDYSKFIFVIVKFKSDDFDAALEDLKQFMFTSEGVTNERSEIIKNSLDLLLD